MPLTGGVTLAAALAAEADIHGAELATLPSRSGLSEAVERALDPARRELLRVAAGADDDASLPGPPALPGLSACARLRALLLVELIRWEGRAEPATLAGMAFALERELPAEFVRRVPGADLAGEARPEVVAVARETFAEIQGIVEALHPPDRRPLHQLAAVINSHAGRYPIAGDLREVAAGMRAGHRSWLRFAYYRLRYGERGRRFTWSDSAWLATLPALRKADAWHQVEWIARVLSSRGMPQWMTEDHLMLLHEELCRAVPERASHYGVLADGANILRDARRRQISPAATARLSAEFDAAVGPELRARLPETGALLAAAVADERLGVDTAVGRLEAFLTDAERFPPRWITAVRETLARARTL